MVANERPVIAFNLAAVRHLLVAGSPAPSSGGYFVSLDKGLRGLDQLIVHEGAHAGNENIFGAPGSQDIQPRQARERDADKMIQRAVF